jgi:hypothetical protein
MSILKEPTKFELEVLIKTIQERRVALLKKFGEFPKHESVNMMYEALNDSYNRTQKQLDTL